MRLVISIEDVKVGDIIEYKYKTHIQNITVESIRTENAFAFFFYRVNGNILFNAGETVAILN